MVRILPPNLDMYLDKINAQASVSHTIGNGINLLGESIPSSHHNGNEITPFNETEYRDSIQSAIHNANSRSEIGCSSQVHGIADVSNGCHKQLGDLMEAIKPLKSLAVVFRAKKLIDALYTFVIEQGNLEPYLKLFNDAPEKVRVAVNEQLEGWFNMNLKQISDEALATAAS